MKKIILNDAQIEEIVRLRNEERLTRKEISQKMGIGEHLIQKTLKEQNVEFFYGPKKRTFASEVKVQNVQTKKYIPHEGKHYIAVSKIDGTTFNDYENSGGFLTSYIRNTLGVEVPSLRKRQTYYKYTGNYWYEQYFDIIEVDDTPTRKCPYCDWTTEKIEDDHFIKAIGIHLKIKHGKTIPEMVKEFPDEYKNLKYSNPTLNRQMEQNPDNFIACQICGKKLARIDWKHLDEHGITLQEYKEKYGPVNYSKTYKNTLLELAHNMNLSLENKHSKYTSKYEHSIIEYFHNKGVECGKNRSILYGKEIDIYFPQQKIGVEFNGLQWHSENFGKKGRYYHINKTKEAEAAGIQLVHIFEDEFVNHKNIVYSKLSHLLKLDKDFTKIAGRKTTIKEIKTKEAKEFLNTYHIQGYGRSTVYLGAFYKNNLMAVMSFRKERNENDKWELTRFATDYHYIFQGVGGKLFKHFIKEYNPSEVKSFADRRWTLNKDNNLYTKLGFILEEELKPNYTYFSSKVNRVNRVHKFNMRKQILHRKYGLPLSMTEREMTEHLGYDRIWDCGLFKYVWKKVI